MHTWLPDAHAEAPAARSRDDVGQCCWQWRSTAGHALGGRGERDLRGPRSPTSSSSALGLLSLGMAAFSLVRQKTQAVAPYSSMEHTGLVCVGLGLGRLRHVRRHAAPPEP